MNTFNKTMMLFQLCLVTLGLAVGQSARANEADVNTYCTGCHGLTIMGATGSVIIGNGARTVPQKSAEEWLSIVRRMDPKGAGFPNEAEMINVANYLASLLANNTTCYKADGTAVTSTATHFCPGGTSHVAPPTTCSSSFMMLSENQKWTCINTPPALPLLCKGTSGTITYYYYAAGNGLCL